MKDLDRRIKASFHTLAREIPVPEFHMNVRDALPEIQPIKRGSFRKYTVAALCAVIFLTAVTAYAKEDLMKIVTYFTSSGGGGNLIGVSFKTGKNSGSAFSEPAVESLNASGYNGELEQMVGLSFPRLTYPDLIVKDLHAELVNKEKQLFLITVWGQIPRNQHITLSLYHNVSKKMVIDGMTNRSPDVKQIDLHGAEATYVKSDGHFVLAWKRGKWSIVLNGRNLAEETLFAIAENIDRQAAGGE